MSNDILSGGRIDESTDGPNPSSVDPRGQDILGEQKAKEQQDAVGGTQYAPRVEPPPPIPVAQEVAPPLPVVPSNVFNVSGSVLEEVREISRQAMVDAFKNVTINGQSPSMEGSTISFNVPPPQPSASETFSFQNGSATPVAPTTTPTPSPQQQPREDTQAVVVPPPSRPREETERRGVDSADFGTGGNAEFMQPAFSSLSDYTTFGRPPQETQERPSRLDAADFGSGPRLSEDRPSRLDDADFGSGTLSDIEAKQEIKREEDRTRREEEKENRPNFDRESDIRQQGETMSEYKERQERLEQKEIEKADVVEGEAILTRESSGPIAVQLERADGQGKVFAFFRSDFSTLDEPTLPKSKYYVGGGGGPHPWKISLKTEGSVVQYKVDFNSTLYKSFDSFDNIAVTGLDFWASASTGYLYIFGVVSDGVCTKASIQRAASKPSRIGFVGEEQNAFSVLIAYLYNGGNGGITVQQRAFHDFTLIDTCVGGKLAIYPIAT